MKWAEDGKLSEDGDWRWYKCSVVRNMRIEVVVTLCAKL
jgi:hypothetical protein